MAKLSRKRLDRFDVLNIFLAAIAAVGAFVMVFALVIAISGMIRTHGRIPTYNPTASADVTSSTPVPTNAPVIHNVSYTFSKAKDLKAFKQAGFGTVTITPSHRMMIKSSPASKKSVSLTVHVDGGSKLSFDDWQSGDLQYDQASVLIDGWSIKSISGTANGSAKYQVYELSPGKHTIVWQYFTDNTINLPTDAYMVDNIKITNVLNKGWY